MGKDNYIQTISEHISQCIDELDQVADKAEKSDLTPLEYRGMERLLQVLIESCIGFGKQWVKHCGLTVAPEALRNYQILFEAEKITREELDLMRAVIGMRNVLVHDYLEVDYETVDDVIKNRLYQNLGSFIQNSVNRW